MHNKFQFLKDYLKDKSFIISDTALGDQIITAVEINNPNLDFIYNSSKSNIDTINNNCTNNNEVKNNNELLFGLFYLFTQRKEYSFTLGLSTKMHKSSDHITHLYKILSHRVSFLSKNIVSDKSIYYIPFKRIEPNIQHDNDLFFTLTRLIYEFTFGLNPDTILTFLENLQLNDYDRIPESDDYNIFNCIHINNIYRIRKENLINTKIILQNLKSDFGCFKNSMRSKCKFNYFLRNFKQITNLPDYIKGIMLNNSNFECSFFLYDFSKLKYEIVTVLLIDNIYIKYYLILWYINILKEKKMISDDEALYGYLKLEELLKRGKNKRFIEMKLKWLKNEIENISEIDLKPINSGLIFLNDLIV